MGKDRRVKSLRRQARAAAGDFEREMERQGVLKRHRLAEITLRTPQFIRGWRGIVSLRDGTDREVTDIQGAHDVAIEVLVSMGVDMADLKLTLDRKFNNTIAFYCRPDGTRIRQEIVEKFQRAAGERAGAAKAVAA